MSMAVAGRGCELHVLANCHIRRLVTRNGGSVAKRRWTANGRAPSVGVGQEVSRGRTTLAVNAVVSDGGRSAL